MPRYKLFVMLAAFAVSAAVSSPGFARGGHSGGHSSSGHSGGHNGGHGGGHGHGRTSVGVFIGPAWYPPYYYYPYPPYYPYYYYPPVVTAPPTYIEQASPQALSAGYWYYCGGTNAYYPYVKECPGGWQPVAPTPAQ